MSFESTRQAIESHFAANWLTTPIAYENVDFTPPTTSWVMLRILSDSTETIGLGSSRLVRHVGSVQVLCYVEDGAGAQGAEALADDVIALYRSASVTGVVFRAATAKVDGSDATHFQVTVTVPFHRDEVV